MSMHPNANFFAKTATALALLLSFGLVGQTCSTESPTVVFDPDAGGGDGGPGDGGGGSNLPDQGPSSPEHGALILEGRPVILDAQPNGLVVDCHTVISIYFSESMKAKTITNGSFEFREKTFGTLVSTTQSTWLMGGRLLIIEPQLTLQPSTTYQLTAFEGPVDLDGLAFDPTSSPVILEFTTASTADGIPPQVIASYPLGGAVDQPNDNQAVVVFSKQIDSTTITPAVSFSNLSTASPGAFDTSADSASRHSGDRVFSFDHLDDDVDLAANLQIDIAGNVVADSSIQHLFLEDAYSSNWTSLDFQRPAEVLFDPADFAPFPPAANLSNNSSFPVQIQMGLSSLAADMVTARIHQHDDNHVNDSRLVEVESVAGAGLVDLSVDLTSEIFGVPTPVFEAESEMLFGAYTQRSGKRSTVTLYLDENDATATLEHDLLPPSLTQFGPPYGSFLGQFRSSLPVIRPYGVATESIGHTNVPQALVSNRFVPAISDDNFFIASSFDPAMAIVDEGPVDFDILLTDSAGNPALSSVAAEAHFSGFVGGVDLLSSGGQMRVVAFDQLALFPLVGATIHIEDLGGGNEDVAMSGSDGSVLFTGRVGFQTVTIQRGGWHAVTLVGLDASIVSLPLRSISNSTLSVSPLIENLNTGISRISSNILATDTGESDLFMVQDFSLDLLFGDAVNALQNRPAWFVAFHEVENYPSGGRYFRFAGLDSRVLMSPSTSSSIAIPEVEMAESTNTVAGTTDYIYPLQVTQGAGIGAPLNSGASASTVIPGISGPVVVGAGSVSLLGPGTNGEVELEINMLANAIQEGADLSNINLNVFAEDASGNSVTASQSATVAVSPAAVPVLLPDVPTTSSPWIGAGYPFTTDFVDTLALSQGVYVVRVSDSSAAAGEWDIYVLASAANGGAVTMPSLKDSPADLTPQIPLSTDGFVSWSAYTQAFEMASGFVERGFFFDVMRRDKLRWAKSKLEEDVANF